MQGERREKPWGKGESGRERERKEQSETRLTFDGRVNLGIGLYKGTRGRNEDQLGFY